MLTIIHSANYTIASPALTDQIASTVPELASAGSKSFSATFHEIPVRGASTVSEGVLWVWFDVFVLAV